MTEIGLTPAGNLRWAPDDTTPAPSGLATLRATFESDWRDGLIRLAADKREHEESLSLRFWRKYAEAFLSQLCHLPERATFDEAPGPDEVDCAQWILTAPPMTGGEYLSSETLRNIWTELIQWCATVSPDGVAPFLEAHAARWRQVGRVCFHLAENKNDPDRPFAFMATYVSGLGALGTGAASAATSGAEPVRGRGQPGRAGPSAFARPRRFRTARLDSRDSRIGRYLPSPCLDGRSGLQIPARRSRNGGERAGRPAARLVAAAPPTAGGRYDRRRAGGGG